MTTTEMPVAYSELTNTCTCTVHDEETDTFTDSSVCFGTCYEDELYFFGECLNDFLSQSDTFRVSGIRLWNREVGGVFQARTVSEFVRAITVDSEWILRYRVFSDRVEFSLSHHDAPTGSASLVVPVFESDDE